VECAGLAEMERLRMDVQWLLAAVVLTCVVAAGCNDGDGRALPPPPTNEPGAPPAPVTPPVVGTLRYLALGDSYTKGESVPPAERWPVQLVARLRAAGLDVADPQIIAETGWRTDDLDAGINAAAPTGPFDLVSLLIGVNNQFQNRSVGQYRVEFEALLRRAVALVDGDPSRVLVLSIPDYGATPYGQLNDPAAIAAGVEQFNAVNRELSRAAGVRYVDITPGSKLAATDPNLTAPDDLHPSGKMYATWADLALPAAQAALAQPTTGRTASQL
jgi:lysophospholipase L1-like esterase